MLIHSKKTRRKIVVIATQSASRQFHASKFTALCFDGANFISMQLQHLHSRSTFFRIHVVTSLRLAVSPLRVEFYFSDSFPHAQAYFVFISDTHRHCRGVLLQHILISFTFSFSNATLSRFSWAAFSCPVPRYTDMLFIPMITTFASIAGPYL